MVKTQITHDSHWRFELPTTLSVASFMNQLTEQFTVISQPKQPSLKSYYDSFDWRLYAEGLLCEFIQTKPISRLRLLTLDHQQAVSSTELTIVPSFANQFSASALRDILEPLLEMRALLRLCSLEYHSHPMHLINAEQKIILRLQLDSYQNGTRQLLLTPIKGYKDQAGHVLDVLTRQLGLIPEPLPLLLIELKRQGRKPKEYSAKLAINLVPDMRADIASKYIYSHLLKTIKDNTQGVIHNTDSEFLHDFRVAVRRTRAGLSQIKNVFPESINACYSEFFSWLGQITGPTRDLDVYLLNFERYKTSLPEAHHAAIQSLYDFLLQKQQKAQAELAVKLNSEKFLTTLEAWESYLKEEVMTKPLEANAILTIKTLADTRIWKVFNRVIQEGNAITDQSAPDSLHNLRKTCKKLRYLMEFFQTLYPEKDIKRLIGYLKALQEVLGDFQDYQVQESHLRLFSEEMAAQQVSLDTLTAIDILIANLHRHAQQARQAFKEQYTAFKKPENQTLYRTLYRNH